MLNSNCHKVIIKNRAKPDYYEMKCAFYMIDYFDSDIEIIPSNNNPSPDTRVVRLNQFWEIKNIRGNGKNAICHTLSKAASQSVNVIITLLRTKITPKVAIGRLKHELEGPTSFKRVLVLTKSGKIIVVK